MARICGGLHQVVLPRAAFLVIDDQDVDSSISRSSPGVRSIQ
jgi:hypothetical protein